MNRSDTPSPNSDDTDANIKKLEWLVKSHKAEAAWYEGQATHASKAASNLIVIFHAFLSNFQLLLSSFSHLSKSSADCSTNINNHFIEHIRDGRPFDPDYVRLQVAALTEGATLSTESMKKSVDNVFKAFESLKEVQAELLKAPLPFEGVDESI